MNDRVSTADSHARRERPRESASTHMGGGHIKAAEVQVHGVWMPCEYVESPKHGIRIVALADVYRESLPDAPDQLEASLAAAAEIFFARIAPHRKLLILVSDPAQPPSLWRCQQKLKRELTRALEGDRIHA